MASLLGSRELRIGAICPRQRTTCRDDMFFRHPLDSPDGRVFWAGCVGGVVGLRLSLIGDDFRSKGAKKQNGRPSQRAPSVLVYIDGEAIIANRVSRGLG